MQEVTLGKTKYLYQTDTEAQKDHLIDQSNNTVKINITFSKNPDSNKKAKEGLRAFFSELYS